MNSIKQIALALVVVSLLACNQDEDNRFERIQKLRALGVASTPTVLIPNGSDGSQPMKLSFYVAAPIGSSLQYEAYEDEKSRFALPIKLEIAADSEKKTDYANFSIYQIDATLTPPPAAIVAIPPDQGFVRLRYGLKVTSAGEEEIIVGNAVLYANGDARPDYQPLAVEIVTPENQTQLSKDASLEANINNPNSEDVKIGWFVSSGTVKNRRARITTWQNIASGTQTVIVTVRGLKSGAFAFDVHEISGS